MSGFGTIVADTVQGSGAQSLYLNNGTNNVLGITTGNNIQLIQSGGGIVFNNSSALTNSTLNDYETGTWTPVAVSGTTSTAVGYYTKVGNLVYLYMKIIFSSIPSVTSCGFSGVPFAVGHSSPQFSSGGGREDASVGYAMVTQVNPGSTSIGLNYYDGSNFATKALSSFNAFIVYQATF